MPEYILPEDFLTVTESVMGSELWHALLQGLADEAPVSVRINPLKCPADWLPAEGRAERVEWCEGGYYLSSRPNFTFDPLFHAGMYYVQEASSMFLDRVLRSYAADGPVMMLDLCAAPGGKSGVARAALPEGSLLVSNEPVARRASVLVENMAKLGHEDVMVTNNYPCDIGRSGLMFDVMLADVPCSGEGMFRKDPAAVGEWSLQNVEKCWRLQRSIVADAWPCLRRGGLFVYSTCTFNTKENEENVKYICEELGAEMLTVDVSGEWRITGSLLPDIAGPVYRFLPGVTRGEGLFMAVMRKTGGSESVCRRKCDSGARGRKHAGKGAEAAACAKWLKRPEAFDTVNAGGVFLAIPKAWRGVYDTAVKSLKVVSAGVRLGEAKGKDVVPAQSLALSGMLADSAFPRVGLDYDTALSYLRKEAVALPTDAPRGYVVVTYRGVPLGFEKNIGNRANNLYPTEWKIKSSHTPEGNNELIKRTDE